MQYITYIIKFFENYYIMSIIKIQLFIYTIIYLFFNFVYATIYSLNADSQCKLIGRNLEYVIPTNNTQSLEYYSNKFQVGLRNMLEVNHDVDLYLPNSKKILIIPKQLILPNTPHTGIIINSVETRLFYYPKDSNIVVVFPISIGTIDHETPLYWSTTIKLKKKIQFGFPPKICTTNI